MDLLTLINRLEERAIDLNQKLRNYLNRHPDCKEEFEGFILANSKFVNDLNKIRNTLNNSERSQVVDESMNDFLSLQKKYLEFLVSIKCLISAKNIRKAS